MTNEALPGISCRQQVGGPGGPRPPGGVQGQSLWHAVARASVAKRPRLGSRDGVPGERSEPGWTARGRGQQDASGGAPRSGWK